jgi:phytoene synthase
LTPDAYCREKAARPGSTLYYAVRFVPRQRQLGVIAVAAFCREMRDIAKASRERDVARTKLSWWRTEIGTLRGGTPRHPIAIALSQSGAADVTKLEEIVAGAEMDLEYNAYPDFDALNVYLKRLGGALGSLWADACGYDESHTREAAAELGVAFELTRIIRDVGEDARRDRIYLPLHELAAHGVTSDDIAHGVESDNFRKLLSFQVNRAERTFTQTLARFPHVDRKAQRSILANAAINRALLAEIRADGFRVLTRRTSLTPLRKLWLAWRTPL